MLKKYWKMEKKIGKLSEKSVRKNETNDDEADLQ